MTLKQYLNDRSLEAQARVLDVRVETEAKAWVQLDRTIFHAQGGGQKADRGTLGGLPVLAVAHTSDGSVDHLVDLSSGMVERGQDVVLLVDAEGRALHSRYHTAGHLLADLVCARHAGLRAKAGHQWPGEARVEFEGQLPEANELTQHLLADLETAISADLPVRLVGDPFSSRAVQIGDYPVMPCGGTHVLHLRELGSVRVRSVKGTKHGGLRVGYELV